MSSSADAFVFACPCNDHIGVAFRRFSEHLCAQGIADERTASIPSAIRPWEKMMSHLKSDWRVALLAAGFLAAAPTALYAQEPPAQDPADEAEQAAPESATTPESATDPAAATAATPVPDTKIDQFATAYVAVQAIQAKTSEQLSTAPDTEKANQVKAAAENEMIKAVQQSGLQVDEFNQIAQAMASDVALRSKVIEKVQQRSKG
jgi:hypothetical protein